MELTQGEVLEATVDQSSSSEDSVFDKKLISPKQKKAMHGRLSIGPVPEYNVVPRNTPAKIIKTPEPKKRSPDSKRMMRDLQIQIIQQQNLIGELQEKLRLITEITNDTIKRKAINDRVECAANLVDGSKINVGGERTINVRGGGVGDSGDGDASKNTNTINLYIN